MVYFIASRLETCEGEMRRAHTLGLNVCACARETLEVRRVLSLVCLHIYARVYALVLAIKTYRNLSCRNRRVLPGAGAA